MSWTKYKIGQLISTVDERNNLGLSDFYGININKEFMPTVANTEGLDASKYKVVRKNRFVFSGMQTGRDVCIRISMYTHDIPIIVSPAYTTFEISSADVVIPMYFFMCFLSFEKDRLGWFFSDGSVRSNLDWDRFCDIELEIPDIQTQKKYVDLYQAFIANQQSYERGLEDLKLVCEGYIKELRHTAPVMPIRDYLVEMNERNDAGLSLEAVRGLATSKEMIPTKADMHGVSLKNYKVVKPRQIAYVPDTSRRGDKVSLGFNDSDEDVLVSSISVVFGTDHDYLLPEYLMLFLTRSEFDRYARYNSWGSARETFTFDDLGEMKIPIPSIGIQQSISQIFATYKMRNSICERLKSQLSAICPILIRGSLSDGG